MMHRRPRSAGVSRGLAGHRALGLVLGLSLIPLSTFAEAPAQETAEAPASVEAEAVAVLPLGTEGLVVYRDPETGRFTSNPTDAQRAQLRQALANSMNRSDEGLTEVVLPNGGVMVNLEGRFQNASYLARHTDDSLHQDCTHSLEALQEALAGPEGATESSPGTEAETTPETDRNGRAIQ